jgi:hypothetical protein
MKKKNDEDSTLSHTKWNCQYHIIFSPKYRRKTIYGKLRRDIGRYLRRLCDYKGVEIVEANAGTNPNSDDSVEYLFKKKYGVAVVTSTKYGVYLPS